MVWRARRAWRKEWGVRAHSLTHLTPRRAQCRPTRGAPWAAMAVLEYTSWATEPCCMRRWGEGEHEEGACSSISVMSVKHPSVFRYRATSSQQHQHQCKVQTVHRVWVRARVRVRVMWVDG